MKGAKNSHDFTCACSVIQLTFVFLTALVNNGLLYKCRRKFHPICKDPVPSHILFAYLSSHLVFRGLAVNRLKSQRCSPLTPIHNLIAILSLGLQIKEPVLVRRVKRDPQEIIKVKNQKGVFQYSFGPPQVSRRASGQLGIDFTSHWSHTGIFPTDISSAHMIMCWGAVFNTWLQNLQQVFIWDEIFLGAPTKCFEKVN